VPIFGNRTADCRGPLAWWRGDDSHEAGGSVDTIQNDRAETIGTLAGLIVALGRSRPVRVAIDGRTASGKTTLADELAAAVERAGRPVIRTSIDGFHRPKIERYARGRNSAEGYYRDARDLGAIRALLLDPLGPGGSGLYRTASFDLERDCAIEQAPLRTAADSILIVDGTFLQRPELNDGWDVTVFVDTSEDVAEQRGVGRDAAKLGGAEATRELYATRYRPAFAMYEQACRPASCADAVVDNNDLARPRLQVRPGGRLALGR
jgi:uridine kinase